MKFISRLIQRIITVIIGFVAIWLIVTQIFDRLDQRLPLFIALMVTYLLSAYVVLPRIVRLASLILKKGHIPRFTRSSDGLYIDPVNLILLGTQADLESAFRQIGWEKADLLTLKSAWKMVTAFIQNKAYPTAPFGSLFLFSRRQDLGFQQAVNNSPRRRHHVRFWATNTNEVIDPLNVKFWLQKQEIDYKKIFTWVGAGSEDIGFGFARLTYQLSHKIDHNIDKERQYILTALKKANCIGEVSCYQSGTFKVGKYISDGQIAIAKLRRK